MRKKSSLRKRRQMLMMMESASRLTPDGELYLGLSGPRGEGGDPAAVGGLV